MLDGVHPRPINLTRDVQELSREVRDTSLSITDRLESLEDIINLEVGDTALTRLRNLERDHGLRQLFIKFEGDNPSGTQKDRIAFDHITLVHMAGEPEITHLKMDGVLDITGTAGGAVHENQ
jgi:threonine synthase